MKRAIVNSSLALLLICSTIFAIFKIAIYVSSENARSVIDNASAISILADERDDNTTAMPTLLDANLVMSEAPALYKAENSTIEFTLISQNAKLGLYVDRKTGLIGLYDKQSAKFYFSSPPDTDNYGGIDWTNGETVKSQIVVFAMDDLGNKIQLMSMTDSVLNKTISLKKSKEALICIYTFEDAGITIPVEFSLADDYLQVKIDPAQVKETGEYKVYSIKVMPYFGAIKGDESGYLFVPDGSGALFRANTLPNGQFYNDIYGYEEVLEKEAIKSFQEKLLIPVFGISNGNYGVFGIIDSGFAKCGIGAENAQSLLQLNNIYPVFNMRTATSINLPAKNWVMKSVSVLEKYPDLTVNFKVRYYPLQDKKNSYLDMANMYRNYLMEEQNVSQLEANELYDGYLDLYGYIKKSKTILGWPVVVDETLTSLSQVKEIMSEYTNKNLKLGIRYSGWIRDGYFYKIPQNAKVASSVGSAAELKEVAQYAEENNFTLFPSVDPISVYKSGNGFNYFKHSTKTINNISFIQYFYPINLQYKSYEASTNRLLSPNELIGFTNTFLNSYNKLAIGALSFDKIGNIVYSDYGSDPCSRYKAAENIRQILKTAGEKNEIMLNQVASYAFGYTKHSIAAPYESSNYMMNEESVPFYQIALRGLINVSSPAINMDGEPQKAVLKCFETGTLPLFSFIGEGTEKLNNSTLNNLYAAGFDGWSDYSLSVLTSFALFNKQIKGKTIIEHQQLSSGVYKTVFDGGACVIVNYNNEKTTVEDLQIEALSYRIIERG